MTRTLTRQIVIRVSQELHDALVRDADANERTVAQTVRFHLRKVLVSVEDSEHGLDDV